MGPDYNPARLCLPPVWAGLAVFPIKQRVMRGCRDRSLPEDSQPRGASSLHSKFPAPTVATNWVTRDRSSPLDDTKKELYPGEVLRIPERDPVLLYTSGTTGAPKRGARLTHAEPVFLNISRSQLIGTVVSGQGWSFCHCVPAAVPFADFVRQCFRSPCLSARHRLNGTARGARSVCGQSGFQANGGYHTCSGPLAMINTLCHLKGFNALTTWSLYAVLA